MPALPVTKKGRLGRDDPSIVRLRLTRSTHKCVAFYAALTPLEAGIQVAASRRE
jgi:hypothetical protein